MEEKGTVIHKTVIEKGIGFGAVLAIVMSWSANHSIIWAIVHGLFSWFYVIFYAMGLVNQVQ